MRIGMDLMPLAYTLTGIGVYLQQLIAAIHRVNSSIELGFPTHCELPFAPLMRRLLSRNLDASELNKLVLQLRPGISPFGPLRKYGSHALDCRGFDLYHVTNSYSLYQRYSCPTVVSVFDLADLRCSNDSARYAALIPAIKQARCNLCISEATRRDVGFAPHATIPRGGCRAFAGIRLAIPKSGHGGFPG